MKELWVYLAVDGRSGAEEVLVWRDPETGLSQPMLASSEAVAAAMGALAVRQATRMGCGVRLVKFSARTDLEGF